MGVLLYFVQVVLEVLLAAHKHGKRFRVVVVDGRPELEGREMLRRLLQVGVGSHIIISKR
jgi:translation initiation factor eIF-2B subunit delta